jgi:DNA topoisomerase III
MLQRKRTDERATDDYLAEKRGGGGLGSGADGGGRPGGTGVRGADENGEKEDAGEAHPPRPLLSPPLQRRPALINERPPPPLR